MENVAEYFTLILVVKGQSAEDHCKQNDSAAPRINLLAVILNVLNYFGSSIVRRATCRFESIAVFKQVTKTEVGDFQVHLVVKEYVLWL